MTPLRDNILVIEAPGYEDNRQTSSGIILSQAIDSKMKPARVIAVGPYVEPTECSPGEDVILLWDKIIPVQYEGQKAGLIEIEHVKAIV